MIAGFSDRDARNERSGCGETTDRHAPKPAIAIERSTQLDEELLRELDRRPETNRDGRSAVIKRALQLYLEHKRREAVDEGYARAYGSRGSRVTQPKEFDELLDSQAWPDEP